MIMNDDGTVSRIDKETLLEGINTLELLSKKAENEFIYLRKL